MYPHNDPNQLMKNKLICHISTVHSLDDSRIFYKECQTLAKNNYHVNLVINAERSDCIDGINVVALSNSKNRFFRIFFSSFIAFFKALKTRSAIYHFHDPELIFIGLLFKILGKKVIYDVHEDLREDILLKDWIGGRSISKLVSFGAGAIEKLADIFFDAIVTATPKISSHFNPRKTVTLRNFVILSNFTRVTPSVNIASKKSGKNVLIYVGSLARIRGIKEIIEAMDIIKTDAELWLIGKWENEEFKSECESLLGFRNTKYFGHVKHDLIPAYLQMADVGLVTLHPTNTYLESYPIKVFEYMGSGLPVIMSDFPLWNEMFRDAAIFVDPLNVKDIARKIEYTLSENKSRESIATNGKKLIMEEYNWEMESQKLISLYDRLLKSKY